MPSLVTGPALEHGLLGASRRARRGQVLAALQGLEGSAYWGGAGFQGPLPTTRLHFPGKDIHSCEEGTLKLQRTRGAQQPPHWGPLRLNDKACGDHA